MSRLVCTGERTTISVVRSERAGYAKHDPHIEYLISQNFGVAGNDEKGRKPSQVAHYWTYQRF
jgi:hypothetical protein